MGDLSSTSYSLLEGEDDDPVAICGFQSKSLEVLSLQKAYGR